MAILSVEPALHIFIQSNGDGSRQTCEVGLRSCQLDLELHGFVMNP